MQVFEKAGNYEAFERVLSETLQEAPMRVCSYCVMPNHWHMLLWPEQDRDLARFMQRLTITHVRRWQEHRHCVGLGHVSQGRYKSFPVEESTAPTTRRNWRRCAAASREAVPTAPRNGSVALRSVLAWNPRTVRPVVPGSPGTRVRFRNHDA
ncbi:MAG: transposase [Planctomycetota bacterium]